MRWWSRADDRASVLTLVPDAVAEGAWLTIAYVFVSVLVGGAPPRLGIVEFSALAGLGIVLATDERVQSNRGVVLGLVTGTAGIVGWLIDGAARTAILSGDLLGALALHPAGWLAAVAVARGAVHADRTADDLVVGRLLAWGIPGIAVAWIVIQLSTPAARATFTAPAFVGTLAFTTSSLVALAVARLEALDVLAEGGFRANRPWLALLAGIVLLMTAIGVPVALLLGLPLDTAIRGALGPLAVLLEIAVVIVAIPFGILAGALVALLHAVAGNASVLTTPPPVPLPPGTSGPQSSPAFLAPLLLAAAILAGLGVILVLVRFARRFNLPSRGPAALEERRIEIPADVARLGRPRLPWHLPERQRAPVDAVSAYVALMRDIADAPGVARDSAETPGAHARRLRRSTLGTLSLDLLAADYALARYASRPIRRSEDRRAIARWRRLRRDLRERGGGERPPA